MTWTAATDQTTTYERPADIDNRYVAVGYIQNGYLLPEQVWTSSSNEETTWGSA